MVISEMKSKKQFNINTMKYKMTSAIGLLLFFCSTISFYGTISACNVSNADNFTPGDTVKVISSPALIPLVNIWAGKFSSMNPLIKVSVSSSSDFSNSAGKFLCFAPESKSETGSSNNLWKMVIGHNAVVPVVNTANPMINEIISQGITPNEFKKLVSGNEKALWSEIISGGKDLPVHIYLTSGDDISAAVSEFTGSDLLNKAVITFAGPEEIISLVEKDVNSIGFCKLAGIRDPDKNELKGNITLLPIDRNGNGRVDSFEKIYGNPDELARGIWIGKYPASLCGSIYAFSNGKPAETDQIAFLNWILTEGSQYMSKNGYVALAGIERENGLIALASKPTDAVGDVHQANSYAFIIILASIAVLVTLIIVVIRRAVKSKSPLPVTFTHVSSAFNENTVESPKGLLFDKSHTWAFMERDGMLRFGVDDFIQQVTGNLTGIKLKEPGEFVRRGEKIISIIKDGKQIDLYSPVSGTIRSLNTDLDIDASIINSSPYTDGWIYLIEPKNWAREMQLMFMSDKYRTWLSDEFDRLKLFLSTVTRENSTCAQVIMQDGGELTENALADMEPEVWEDFQTRFIDVSR